MIKWGKLILSLLLMTLMVEIIVFAPRNLDEKTHESQSHPLMADENKTSSTPEEDGLVEQRMQGAHLVETKEGGKEWELWAASAISYKDKSSWSLQGVKTKIFSKNGAYFDITGEKGLVDMKTKDMKIQGHVIIKSSNDYLFQTDEVTYVSTARHIQAPSIIKMWGPKDDSGYSLILKGIGLEADMNDSLIRILRDVVAEKAFEDKKRLLIKSQKAFFSGRTYLARFQGNVVMDFESMRIIGPEAVFEYASDSKTVKAVQVSGGVRVSDIDKWATAENVNINFAEDKYVFKGSPRVVQNNDELLGQEIVFWNGGQNVDVYKAKANVDQSRWEGSH